MSTLGERPRSGRTCSGGPRRPPCDLFEPACDKPADRGHGALRDMEVCEAAAHRAARYCRVFDQPSSLRFRGPLSVTAGARLCSRYFFCAAPFGGRVTVFIETASASVASFQPVAAGEAGLCILWPGRRLAGISASVRTSISAAERCPCSRWSLPG